MKKLLLAGIACAALSGCVAVPYGTPYYGTSTTASAPVQPYNDREWHTVSPQPVYPAPVYAAPVYAAPVYPAPVYVQPPVSFSFGFLFGGHRGGHYHR